MINGGHEEGFTYVDIGANKGESLSTVLKYWVDIVEHFALEESTKLPACGFNRRTPVIFAVEPMSANVELLKKLRTKLPKAVQNSIYIDHAAMGLRPTETYSASLLDMKSAGRIDELQKHAKPRRRLS